MATRTTETTVTFTRPFALSVIDGVLEAGTYRLVVEEEQIPGVSFTAFKRVGTMLHFPAHPAPGQSRQVVQVDPAELTAVLAADAASGVPPSTSNPGAS